MRKAINITKATPVLIMPLAVGGDGAENVDDPENALDELESLAEEQRRRSPEMSKAQAFAKVYTDPANVRLAIAERRQNRPAA